MISVKEFARMHGKSAQAVYQQMKRKENAKALEGHVFEQRIGGKMVKMLDDEAVEVLENSSKQTPSVVVVTDDKERIAELERENELLKAKIAQIQDDMIKQIMSQNERILELTDKVMLLTEKPVEEAKKRHWWQR